MSVIKKISAEKTYPIRLDILRKEINLPYKFKEDFDVSTIHIGAYIETKLVGVASFIKSKNKLINGKNQYQLRGMATLNEVRGMGYGKRMMDFAVKHLKNKGTTVLWCNSRKEAFAFYQKNDFSIIGNSFYVAKLGEHYLMYKKL